MFKLAERVKETTATTGTGTLTLAGAVTGFQTFLSGIGNGSTCTFFIYDSTTGSWEVSEGALSGGTSLTRVTVIASSNAGALVNFTTIGSKIVSLVNPGARQGMLQLGAPTSASASSSIDFTGLDSTYEWYEVQFRNVRLATDTASFYFRVSIAAAFLAANYQSDVLDATGGAAAVTSGTAGAQIQLAPDVDNTAATATISGWVRIHDPGDTTYHKPVTGWVRSFRNTSGVWRSDFIGGAYIGGAGAVDGLRFIASSGNITSGQFTLFGGRG